MTNLTYGSYNIDQTWQWECRRCSEGTWHDDTHYTITRTVAGKGVQGDSVMENKVKIEVEKEKSGK